MSKTLSKHDISSEEYRDYHYNDGVLRIVNPVTLYLVEGLSGFTQRVVDVDGVCYRPTPGYHAISWKQNNDQPFDF